MGGSALRVRNRHRGNRRAAARGSQSHRAIGQSGAGVAARPHSPDRRRMTCLSTPSADVSDYEMIEGTRAVIELLSARWSVDVLYALASGTRRYCELLYEVGEISKKTLTQTLRG